MKQNNGSQQDIYDSQHGGVLSQDSINLNDQNDLKIMKASSVNQKYMTEFLNSQHEGDYNIAQKKNSHFIKKSVMNELLASADNNSQYADFENTQQVMIADQVNHALES